MVDTDRGGSFILLLLEGSVFETGSHLVQSDPNSFFSHSFLLNENLLAFSSQVWLYVIFIFLKNLYLFFDSFIQLLYNDASLSYPSRFLQLPLTLSYNIPTTLCVFICVLF